MEQLYGTGVALVTPFRKDLTVDVEALCKVVDFCIEGGIDYLVILGTTAETATLAKSEKQLVMKTVVQQNAGRVPLVIGIGGNHTVQLADELRSANLHPFDAVLSVSPYYNRPTQEGIYRHFKMLAEASSKPIILYNVPARTGSNMLPDTTLRLASDCENIVAIKEASGNMEQIETIIRGKPETFKVISGDDSNALPTVLAGGAGVISVLGQGQPQVLSKMVQLGLNGDEEQAYGIHQALKEGVELIFSEGNPAGIKAALEFLNLCTAEVRLPLVEASPKLKAKIASYLTSFSGVPI